MVAALTEASMSRESSGRFVVLNIPIIHNLSILLYPTNTKRCTYLLGEEDERPCCEIWRGGGGVSPSVVRQCAVSTVALTCADLFVLA